jgi:hypothetical protein
MGWAKMAIHEEKLGPSELPPRDVLGLLNLLDHAEASKAIVVAGIVEDWLQTLLLAAGRPLSNTQASLLFDGYGPLATFSARIDVAYFFKLIDEPTCNDLRAIKGVRNTFAHSKAVLTFESREIVKKADFLTGSKEGGSLRDLYYDRAQVCLDVIRTKMERLLFDSAFEGDNP